MGIGNVIRIIGTLEDIREVAAEAAAEEAEIIEIPTRAIIRITVKVPVKITVKIPVRIMVKVTVKVIVKVLIKIITKVPVRIMVKVMAKVPVKLINNRNILVKEILTEVTIVAVEITTRTGERAVEEEQEVVAEAAGFKGDGIRVATILIGTPISEVAEANAGNIETRKLITNSSNDINMIIMIFINHYYAYNM